MASKPNEEGSHSVGVPSMDATYQLLHLLLTRQIINPRRACAARVTVVVLSICLSVCPSVCLYVCLSEHAILAVRAVRSITKDAIVLSVRFAAILKRRFS